jgi:hypothetical protein
MTSRVDDVMMRHPGAGVDWGGGGGALGRKVGGGRGGGEER